MAKLVEEESLFRLNLFYIYFFQVGRVVKLVDLSNQVHTFASELSGGQKRKLSVGLALIGDPKVGK
jgi:ABC-type ATPase involved in cell division